METTPGWCLWHCSEDYLPRALQQLTEGGIKDADIKIVYAYDDDHPYKVIWRNPEKTK